MNKIKYIIISICLLLSGCQKTNIEQKTMKLNFDNTQTIIVSSLEEKLISPTQDIQLVNTIIEQYKTYNYKKIEPQQKDIVYSLAWYPSKIQFQTSYNLKFKYNNQFYQSAYDELFNNSSIESISLIDDYTIIYKNEYYKSDQSMNIDLLNQILDLAKNYTMKIYVPNEYFDTLVEKEIVTQSIDEQSVIKELVNVGVIPDFIKINNVKIEDNTVYIDFNQDFSGFITTMGTAGESMIIKAIVNSYIKTYDMEQVQITCNNEILETGHNIYDQPIKYMP